MFCLWLVFPWFYCVRCYNRSGGPCRTRDLTPPHVGFKLFLCVLWASLGGVLWAILSSCRCWVVKGSLRMLTAWERALNVDGVFMVPVSIRRGGDHSAVAGVPEPSYVGSLLGEGRSSSVVGCVWCVVDGFGLQPPIRARFGVWFACFLAGCTPCTSIGLAGVVCAGHSHSNRLIGPFPVRWSWSFCFAHSLTLT